MSGTLLWLALALAAADLPPGVAQPKVLDPRLKIELVSAEPDVVTPTGIAVDSRGRVLVVESHTHFRPPDYQGPPADRIRIYADTDGDGRAETITNFFEGTQWTMNIGVDATDAVYVATRSEIFRLRDTDGDGHADQRTEIAHLETKGNYPHNGLSGFAFDWQGNVYFGLGENLGAPYKLVGSDGSSYSAREGGQIFRCRPDGTQIELVAFGFWNPFHVASDTFGRLFAVDNDPDSLPPCRLMHIVPGGNYGYRYRNGRKGVHPFTAWNGELPGTLPMVAGTGEAPSGLIAYESDNLPAEYVGDLLGTSWGDHRIERFHLEPRGASFQSVGQPLVTGDENFRPVGIACAPDGSLYISDWVTKDYHVHRHGRVWRLSAREAPGVTRPKAPQEAILSAHRTTRESAAREMATTNSGRDALAQLAASSSSERVRALAIATLAAAGKLEPVRKAAADDRSIAVRALAIRSLAGQLEVDSLLAGNAPAEVRAEVLRNISARGHLELLWGTVADADAFVAQAAREGLWRTGAVDAKIDLARLSPPQRLAALLILREKRIVDGTKLLPQFLQDADTSVRFAAIQWVGEERLTDLRQPLAQALSVGPATARLFGGYLAALERLDGVVRGPAEEWAGEQYIVRALDDPQTSNEVRRWSLRMLRPDHPALTIARLRSYLANSDPALQLEAVRTLRERADTEKNVLLVELAADPQRSVQLRAEAVVGLTSDDPAARKLLLLLATGGDAALRNEALRSLRGSTLSSAEQKELSRMERVDSETAELVQRVLQPGARPARPSVNDLAAWMKLLAGASDSPPGDSAAGQRIFFHQKSAMCARCHQVQGRGARVGPELTAVAGALSSERLVQSILQPGREIAPQYTTWLVQTHAGRTVTGMLVKEEATGEQTYVDQHAARFDFKPGEIEIRKPQSTSIMPDDLASQLSLGEFRDLLAFLRSQGETEAQSAGIPPKEASGAVRSAAP